MKHIRYLFIIIIAYLINTCSNQVPRRINRFNRTKTTASDQTTATTVELTDLSSISILTSTSETTKTRLNETCVPPSINDFPRDLFTQTQRRYGGVIFHIIFAIYLFVAILRLCDDYFMNSLEVISERLNLDEDVAGATFMAAGSSAPEVFISLIGVFVAEADVSIGTIVGSAVFNILFVIGICALFVNAAVKLSVWPFFRDSIFYILSVIVLILFIRDNRVYWYESLIMLLIYGVYIFFMAHNEKFKSWTINKFNILQEETNNIIADNGHKAGMLMRQNTFKNYGVFPKSNNDTSGYSRFGDSWAGNSMNESFEKGYQTEYPPYASSRLEIIETNYYKSIKNADLSIAQRNRKIDFDTAVLHIMIKKRYFKTKTTFKMAIRLVIDEIMWIKRNDQYNNQYNGNEAHRHHSFHNKRSSSNHLTSNNTEGCFKGSKLSQFLPQFGNDFGLVNFLKWFIYTPMDILFYFTIPNCKLENLKKWYMLSFIMSIVWLAVLSYFMVWMVTVIGFTIGIPDSIMGITFLAAGASIPDAYSSVVVVKQGYVDMGVSNVFGSNVFDLLIGLAVPWFLKSIFTVGYIKINSNGLTYDSLLLFSCVAITISAIHFRKWHLDRRLGYVFLSVYIAFLIFSSAIELNLFALVNPPMCKT